ncbi:MAG: 2-oxo acid dehydrogenase subunit E2 [Bacilli bacterium]|nr:2-oxo acid dehydrogenase subunit E2 [Bacilli bacterium]
MFGKRSDGKKIKGLSPVNKIIPHIMSARHDSQNLFKYELRCESLDEFIAKEKEEKISINYMHVVIAGIVRLFALRPQLNRFVMNGRIFKRNNIMVSFVVKKALRDDVEETTVKLSFTGKESIYQIKDKIDEAIKANSNINAVNDTDKTAKFFTTIPNFFIKVAVGFIKWLDKHGMLPKKIIDASPFHTSIFVTNLKSIKTDYIYHHIYDFGTTGIFISMGKEKQQAVVDKEGKIVVSKVMTLGVVTDERFCDGLYFGNSLRLLKRIYENPNVLKEELDHVVKDID